MAFTKNQILTLEIESLSSDGNGVAHSDGQAVFIRARLRAIPPGCGSSSR